MYVCSGIMSLLSPRKAKKPPVMEEAAEDDDDDVGGGGGGGGEAHKRSLAGRAASFAASAMWVFFLSRMYVLYVCCVRVYPAVI